MNEWLLTGIEILAASLVGLVCGYLLKQYLGEAKVKSAKAQADTLLAEAQTKYKEMILAAKDEALKIRDEAEAEVKKRPQPERPQATRQTVGRAPTVSPTTRPRPASPFADVEQQVEALRRQVAGGLLTEEECKAQMRDLMVEDANGNWWMVGYETGEWYRHDGTDWVRADPPIARSDERSAGGA